MLIRVDRSRNPFGMGFRLETPGRTNQNANATDKAGIHDFYHAQLIGNFVRSGLTSLSQLIALLGYLLLNPLSRCPHGVR